MTAFLQPRHNKKYKAKSLGSPVSFENKKIESCFVLFWSDVTTPTMHRYLFHGPVVAPQTFSLCLLFSKKEPDCSCTITRFPSF